MLAAIESIQNYFPDTKEVIDVESSINDCLLASNWALPPALQLRVKILRNFQKILIAIACSELYISTQDFAGETQGIESNGSAPAVYGMRTRPRILPLSHQKLFDLAMGQ